MPHTIPEFTTARSSAIAAQTTALIHTIAPNGLVSLDGTSGLRSMLLRWMLA
jgi:hypothetical protein